MRTIIFASILAAILCFNSFVAHGQTEYRIDQQLPGDILKIQVFEGWNVRLVHDTINMLSIATPCEYYFTEGNEPQISRQQANGWLSIWKNTSMPKGTLVEVHYRHSLQRLEVAPGATVNADTLLMFDTTAHIKDSYGHIKVNRGATLRVKEVRCRREIGKPGFLAIDADTAATVHIGTVRAGYLSLWSQQDATLMLDSIDAHKVVYHRDPKAHDNLWNSIPERNITVKTAHRWFADGLKQLDNTIDFTYNNPFEQRYNNPYATTYDMSVIVGLKTNVIPMSQRWGLSLGIDYGLPFIGLMNNVTPNGRTLALDTVSPGVNRQHYLMYMYLSFPVKLHYIPKGRFARDYFNDLHIGLEPRWNFHQRYLSGQYTSSQYRPVNYNASSWDPGMKASIYNPLQVRAEIGCRINPFSNIEFNFYADLLPTYRKETGMGNARAFGFQIKF